MPVLHQKLTIPNFKFASRLPESLVQALDAGLMTGPAAFLAASAGWGKTTSVASWARTKREEMWVAWYSLDSRDRDPVVFLRYLLTGLSPHYPNLQLSVENLDVERSGQELPFLINQILNGIMASPRPGLLILDNVHALFDDDGKSLQPVTEILEPLIRLTNIKLVLLSRVFLPGLSRLVMEGLVTTIDGSALALAPQDVITLVRERYDLAIRADQAEQLVAWASGWPAAIVLAVEDWYRQGIKRGLNVDQVLPTVSAIHLYPFLAEQVFAPLPRPLQQFLLETAVLDDMQPQYCDELRQASDSLLLLAEVQSRGLFVTMYGSWTRYHDVFRSFLLAQLQTDPARAQQLMQRAAELYQRWSLPDSAFHRWIQLNNLEAATALVLSMGPVLRQKGEHVTIQNWLNTLQARAPLSSQLLLLQARIAMDIADWTTATAAIQLAMVGSDSRIVLEARLLEAAMACIRREDARAREIIRSIDLDRLPIDLRTTGYETMGRIALNQGEIPTAIDMFQRALADYNSLLQAEARSHPPAHLYDLLGMALAMHSDYVAALYYLRQADSLWQALGAPIRRVNTLNNLATLATEEGRLADARIHLKEGLVLAEQFSRRRSQVLLLCGLAEVSLFEGRFDEALENYQFAYQVASSAQLSAEQTYICAGAVRVALLGNQPEKRQSWYEMLDYLPSSGIAAHSGVVALVRALVEEAPQVALQYLAQAEAAAYLAPHDRVHIALLRAQLAFEQSGWDAAQVPWRQLEALQPPRHLETLIQAQLSRTPSLLQAAGDTPLARRLGARITVAPEQWFFYALGRFGIEGPAAKTGVVRPLDQLVIIRLVEAGMAGLPVLTLWEDVWGDHYYSADALRQSMSRIRRASNLPIQLRQGHCHLLLPWNNVVYDVARFEVPFRANAATGGDAIALLEQQISLYQGAFLSHLHHESRWVQQRRKALHQRFLSLREKVALLREDDDPQSALHLYLSIFEEDHCNETAAAGAMRCATRLGNRPQAIALYQQARTAILDELGSDPSPLLEQLYREIV